MLLAFLWICILETSDSNKKPLLNFSIEAWNLSKQNQDLRKHQHHILVIFWNLWRWLNKKSWFIEANQRMCILCFTRHEKWRNNELTGLFIICKSTQKCWIFTCFWTEIVFWAAFEGSCGIITGTVTGFRCYWPSRVALVPTLRSGTRATREGQ